jgi:DNA-binding CsgD family transcriptional regulator
MLTVESGDLGAVSQELQQVASVVPTNTRGLFWLALALPIAGALAAISDDDVSRWKNGLAHYSNCLFDWGPVDLTMARLDAATGRWEAAEKELRRAEHLCEAGGLQACLVSVRHQRALVLLASRRPGERKHAMALLRKIEPESEALGLDYLMGCIRAVLTRPGRGRPASSGPQGLTEREEAVLRLLVGGRPTRQIASALFIAEKTVSNHLDHIYAKLGVHSRGEAIAYALQHELVRE